MQVKNNKQYKHNNKNHHYIGTAIEKTLQVDLYFDASQNSYIARYGYEKNNYTSMDKKLVCHPNMVTHVLCTAQSEHRNEGL